MNHTVLLVDDDLNLLEALARQLHGEPYRLITTRSGPDALDIMSKTAVDIVISDQEMPGMKGTQLLWQVKKSFPDVILFMLTGKTTLRVATLAVNEIGISRFFMKPCNAVDLALTIRQALQQQELIVLARGLLRKLRQQKMIIERAEQESPVVLQADRSGGEVIGMQQDDPGDYDSLIREIQNALEQ